MARPVPHRSDRCGARPICVAKINLGLQTKAIPDRGKSITRASASRTTAEKPASARRLISAEDMITHCIAARAPPREHFSGENNVATG
jgi:hypothetical protein